MASIHLLPIITVNSPLALLLEEASDAFKYVPFGLELCMSNNILPGI